MRAKIFSFVKMSADSMVASVKLARFVSEELGVEVVDDVRVEQGGPLDVLIIVNGAFAFCKCLESLAAAIYDAKRVVWIENDYTIGIPKEDSGAESPFRKAFVLRHVDRKSSADSWTTCEKNSKRTKQSRLINWNSLTVEDVKPGVIKKRRAAAGKYLLYYGSFRNGRLDAFDRYFAKPVVETIISSPSQKFKMRYTSSLINHVSKFNGNLYDAIGSAGLGLCCEDKKSHVDNHSPPNRFYEMLSAGVPMIFQPEMGTSLRRGGYDPEKYVARGAYEVPKFMERREEIGEEQRAAWLGKARAERDGVRQGLHDAWDNLRKTL